MSVHLRSVWQRRAAQHLRALLISWRPSGDAAARQRTAVRHLDEVIRVIPGKPRHARFPKHAAMPTIQGRKAA